ncbi:DUF2961 domain-containing protein [Nannocystaceae bacterium ST9]
MALVGVALAQLASCTGEPVEGRDAADFLRALRERDELPRFRAQTSELAAGWDPAGGNELDGAVFDRVSGNVNVLLDVEGPGCIHRISTGDLTMLAGTRIELRLDHELEPRLAMPAAAFFDPAHSPFAELVRVGTYPTVRMPIPFATHAELRLVSDDASHDWGVFWQVGYSRYPDDAPVESLAIPLDAETRDELDRVAEVWANALVGEPRANDPPTARIAQTLAPGESASWSEQAAGTIERLELRVDPNWPAAWQWLRVRATWDDDDRPAIDASAAELLGADHGDDPDAQFDSLLLGVREGRAYLRLPMPYRDAARIELVNAGPLAFAVDLAIWRELGEPGEDFGHLHAHVATAPAASDQSPRSGPMQVPVHRLLDAQGRGKLVGVILRVDWPYESLWWGEGDWQIWVDREVESWPPTYHGTGTEEFFDSGWTQFDRKPLAGLIRDRPGRVAVYGFAINDAFAWEQSIRVQVETLGLGPGNDVVLDQHPVWSSTVFWYDYPSTPP